MKLQKDERGSTAVMVIVVILLVAVTGFVGYRVYNAHKTKPAASTTATSTTKSTASTKAPAVVDPTAGWQTYTCYYGSTNIFSFKYPAGWVAYNTFCAKGNTYNHEEIEVGNLPESQVMTQGGPTSNFLGIDIQFYSQGTTGNSNKTITSSTSAEDYLRAFVSSNPYETPPTVTAVSTRTIGGKVAYQLTEKSNSTGDTSYTGWVVRVPSGIIVFSSTDTTDIKPSMTKFSTILDTVTFGN